VICHQQAARSFAIWSQQLPVCARCTGIYAGAAMIAMLATLRRLTTYAEGFGVRSLRHLEAHVRTNARLLRCRRSPQLAYEWSTNSTPSNVVRSDRRVSTRRGSSRGCILSP
jgi:hypothetical protein